VFEKPFDGSPAATGAFCDNRLLSATAINEAEMLHSARTNRRPKSSGGPDSVFLLAAPFVRRSNAVLAAASGFAACLPAEASGRHRAPSATSLTRRSSALHGEYKHHGHIFWWRCAEFAPYTVRARS